MTKENCSDEGIIKGWKEDLKKKKESRENPMTGGVDLKSLKRRIRELKLKNEKLSLFEGIISAMIGEEKLEISKPNEVLIQCQKERTENCTTKEKLEKREAEITYEKLKFNFVAELEEKSD